MTQPETLIYPIQRGPQFVDKPGFGPVGLGRHVNHDPRSRRYPFRVGLAQLAAVYHERHIPIFDQGQLGSCTCNAGLGILATGPYWAAWSAIGRTSGPIDRYPWNEGGAKQLYSDVTADDDFDGQWPPTDTGSDGLSVGKELVKRGVIPGYQHTFDLNSALAALMTFPLLVGTVWTDQMFYPDSTTGLITPSGPVDGGHEWIVDEYVPAGATSTAGNPLSSRAACIGGTTSWGAGFGKAGRFYMTAANFGKLLKQDGDVMVLTAPTAPAPIPDPEPGTGQTAADVAAKVRQLLTDLGL